MDKEDFKYVLIVSQYWYSRFAFIVKFNKDTFIENAKKCVAELEKYKREENTSGELDYGDLVYRDSSKIFRRYNINDSGDIYFILSECANSLKHDVIEFHDESLREARGFQKRQ